MSLPRAGGLSAGSRPRAVGVLLAVAGLLVFAVAAHLLTRRQPLDRVVAAAAEQARLAFEGTTGWTQQGASGRFQVSGSVEPFGTMTVTVRGGAAGADSRVPSPAAEVRYRIAWPELETGAIETVEPAAIAWHLPAGDPLALVAAGHGAVVGGVEPIDGRRCQRIDFRVAGRAYVDWLRDHRALRANGGVSGLERLEGRGSVWRDIETDLPCRIAVTVALPRFAGASPGEGSADWVYASP